VWKPEFSSKIFPIFSSDTLVPHIGWCPGQLHDWPAP